MNLRQSLNLLIAAGIGAAVAVTAASVFYGNITAQATERELVANVVTADILPPPLYLIELRLVLGMAADGSLPIAEARREAQRLQSEYQARVDYYTAHPPYGLEAQLLGEQHTAARAFLQAMPAVLDAVEAGNTDAVHETLRIAHAHYLQHRKGVDTTVQTAGAFAQGAAAKREAAFTQQRFIQMVLLVASFIGLLVVGLAVRRNTLRSMGGEPDDVARIAQAIARGELTVAVPVHPGDTHSVMAAMALMRERLHGVVSDIHASSEAVATGASQISSGNDDLSQRTERQASDLQQTAAALEEFSGSIAHTADAANQTRDVAIGAAQVATQGAQTMQTVVTTMEDILHASARIRDITSVIDGIAFQTNILALNAAVEAARAGEHGRGFAVVASEVRHLAQRCSAAAKEIHTLISDSNARVDSGTQLVRVAESTMKDIVTQVAQVSTLLEAISTATREQNNTVQHVNSAINALDSTTQKNTALVEESAAAADNLKDTADRLIGVVKVFRLQGA